MYNWYALTDSRGLIPEGWHLPVLDEWTAFEKFVQKNRMVFYFSVVQGNKKQAFVHFQEDTVLTMAILLVLKNSFTCLEAHQRKSWTQTKINRQ